VRHPNLVATFDAVVHDDTFAIVMERLPGPSLADRLADGPLTANEVRAVGLDVLAALGAVHEAGLVHRDVKPANILRTVDGRWKLVDFGIAKNLLDDQNLTRTGTTVGTPAYLAPEQLRGEPTTPTADLWAVGVTLYQALSGQLPFRGDTPFATAYAVQSAEPEPLSTLLPGADPVIVATVERALTKAPDERFDSAESMAAALIARSTARVGPVRPAPVVAQPVADAPAEADVDDDVDDGVQGDARQPALRRRRTIALAAAALVLAVVAAVSLALAPDDDGTAPLEEPVAADEGGNAPGSSTPSSPVSGVTVGSTPEGPDAGGSATGRSTSGPAAAGPGATDPSTDASTPDGPPTTADAGTDSPDPVTPREPGSPTTRPPSTRPPTTGPPPTTAPPTTTEPPPPTTAPTIPDLPDLPITLPGLVTDPPLPPT
jgi:serine/threonine protein kinase